LFLSPLFLVFLVVVGGAREERRIDGGRVGCRDG
jgi:hypothetical protein